MTVVLLSEATQELAINSYNPLLQLSLFSLMPSDDQSERYEHVLGGGNCHFIFQTAFNFASLVAKLPGAIDIDGVRQDPLQPSRIKPDNVGQFLGSYNLHHKAFGITISSESGAYGKTLSIITPEGNAKGFQQTLSEDRSTIYLALKHRSPLGVEPFLMDSWKSREGVSSDQIKQAINTNVAVFSNGQVFLDLGVFLGHNKDQETMDLFKRLFKVDEFLTLRNTSPAVSILKNKVAFNEQLLILQKKSEELIKAGHQKAGDAALELYNTLLSTSEQYFDGKLDKQSFKTACDQAMAPARRELEKHRGWKEFLGNLALAIAGLGIGYLVAGVINKAVTGRFCLYQPQTDSAKKLDAIEEVTNKLSK